MKGKNETSNHIIVALIIGAFVIGGAVYASRSTEGVGETGDDTSVTTTKRLAPHFTLERVGGGTIELADFRGQKPVVLDFFATWCPNCKRDMPHLSALYETYKDQVEVIGIDLQEQEALVETFVNDIGVTFPIALDTDGRVAQQYGVRYTNFHVLIDKEGNVVRSVPGDISEADILSLIAY